MLRYSLPLAVVLALACSAIPARAAQRPQASPQTKRVWTTDDMAGLRARGLISIVGLEAEAAPAPVVAPASTAGPIYASPLENPAWYADQSAELQKQLSAHETALAQARDSLAQAREGVTSGGVNMAAGDTYGVTPNDVIAHLEAQTQETQSLLDELADLARRNGIAPGVLRSAAT
jgi:hypothetical protein